MTNNQVSGYLPAQVVTNDVEVGHDYVIQFELAVDANCHMSFSKSGIKPNQSGSFNETEEPTKDPKIENSFLFLEYSSDLG